MYFLFAFDTLKTATPVVAGQVPALPDISANRGVLKLFKYHNKNFEFKQEYPFTSSIRSLIEIDATNGFFGVVMDGEDGIAIVRIDFITGDFKITLKQTLYKN